MLDRNYLQETGIDYGDSNGKSTVNCNLDRSISFILLHAGVGIALLSNVAFVPSWRPVQDLAFDGSGWGPINATLAADMVPMDFWAWFYGLIVSPNYATSLPPIHCSGSGVACASYFLPGAVYFVSPSIDSFTEHPEANAFVVHNSIGYQIEFYPPESINELYGAACKVYGLDSQFGSVGVELCLKRSGNDLLAGTPIPFSILLNLSLECVSFRYLLSQRYELAK